MQHTSQLFIEAETARIEAQASDEFASIRFVSVLPEYRALVNFENGGWLFSTIHPQLGVISLEVSSRQAGITAALRQRFEEGPWK